MQKKRWFSYLIENVLKKHRTMKISILMFIVVMFNLHANSYAQNKKLTLDIKNETIENVLNKIEAQSKYNFFYKTEDVDVQKRISISVKNTTIKEILRLLFNDQNITHKLIKKQIVLKGSKTPVNTISVNLIPIEEASNIQNTITGTISDSNGEPLPGANIVEKGTSNGVVTDFDGNFSIDIADANATLVVSYIGFATKEVALNGQTSLTVSLAEDAAGLDEVVVVGYGTQRRKDVTGAVASIKAASFADALPVAPEQLLQGKIPGVSIVQSSGQPGAASTVRIRGTSSISAGNEPLYVIDGIPMQFGSANNSISITTSGSTPLSQESINPLSLINPADIESIDVLKDASATAIYGSRGANGVIVITTKNKGKFGEFLTYDAFTGISSIPKLLPFLSADEYRNYANSNGLPLSDTGANTNWQKEVFRTAITSSHNLSFAGGSENTNLTGSIGYNDQEGVLLSSRLKKYTARLNGNHTAIDGKLKLGLNMTYANIDENRAAINSEINDEGGNILKDALRWAPTLPVRNEDGSFYQIGALRVNPVSWQDVADENKSTLFLGNFNASYKILESLTLKATAGNSNENVNRNTNIPSTHPSGEGQGGTASINKYKNTNVLTETTLTFDEQISTDSHLTVLAGYSFQRFATENTFISANNFVSDATKWNLIQSSPTINTTSFKDANRLSSYFGRLNYKLKDRYLFTFTLRRDGSSRFGENYKWGTFPSGAFAWNMTDEDFLKDTKVSNLKLRVGYGITGNQEIPNNLYLEQLSIAGSSIYVLGGQAVPSVLPTNFQNEDLQWEETSQLNFGVDFGFFDHRLSGSVDYYIKKTDNLLLQFSTAAPSVVPNQWANVGEVENKGVEVNLNADVIDTDNFSWSTNLNFATNKNEVITLSNENFQRDEVITSSGSGVVGNNGSTKIIKPGLALNTFYGRQFTGYDADGMETYLDADNDGTADELAIGDANPDWTFGFNNTFRYKKIDVSLNFRGVIGNDIYNNTAAEFSYVNAAPGVNILKSALTTGASRDQTAQFSSKWLEDGSYLRLDNLTVGYTFDMDKYDFIKKTKLYVTGRNLFVLTGYTGYDPEVRTRSVGIDYLVYPRPRVFQIGLSVTF